MRFARKKELTLVLSLLAVFFLASVVIIFNTENSFGGGDPFSHFKLAYWGWKYPRLLFDSWGKPVYTILVSPFAQMGMNFARMYNVLMGLLTAFFSWKLARELKLNNAWLVVLLVLFTPIYFSLMFAALTEVTFSMLLILSLLLFFQRKYFWSAVFISFLPLVRTESVVLFPLFLLAFGLKKQWKVLPFFTVGFFLISWLGRPFYHSFWWLITDMPYKGSAADIYGHGSLFHFINQTGGILGYPIAGLFCVGLVAGLWTWIKKERFRLNQRFYFLLLIPAGYLLYLAAHSYVWWKGMGNSLGLIRVIGAVTPLAAIMALSGFDMLANIFSKYRKTTVAVSAFLLLWIVYAGATTHLNGFRRSQPQQVLAKACSYLKHSGWGKNRIFYFSNYVPYRLGIDPYDNRQASWGVPRVLKVSNALPDGSIIIWDAHFGPNEGRTPLNKLLDDNGLQMVNIFRPKEPFKVLGGYDYAVYIFQKKKSPKAKGLSLIYNFENGGSAAYSFSGRKSYHLMAHQLYFNLLVKNIRDCCPNSSILTVSGEIYPQMQPASNGLLLVISREKSGKTTFYKTFSLSKSIPDQWNHFIFSLKLSKTTHPEEILKVYFWNRDRTECFLDDIRLKISRIDLQ